MLRQVMTNNLEPVYCLEQINLSLISLKQETTAFQDFVMLATQRSYQMLQWTDLVD